MLPPSSCRRGARQRRRRAAARPERGERRGQEREREHDAPQARHVLADGRGHEVGRHRAERPQPEDEREEAAALAAQPEGGAGGAERDHPQQLREAKERVLRLVPVEEEQGALEQADHEQRRSHDERAQVEAAPAGEESGHAGKAQIEERERREARGHDGKDDGDPDPAELQGLERPEGDRQTGGVGVRPCEERAARDDGEHARGPPGTVAPLPFGQRGKERSGPDDRDQCNEVVADQRGREVVEEAVGEERVVARVPVRVPDEHAVLHELRAVEVGGEIARRRAEEHEQEPDRERCDRRNGYLSAHERA
jgi:hypothetical protein